MSNLNAIVPSIMFKMILPRMESNRLGLCIMMGSAAGMAPIGTLPTYGATKSFVIHLTKSLRVSNHAISFIIYLYLSTDILMKRLASTFIFLRHISSKHQCALNLILVQTGSKLHFSTYNYNITFLSTCITSLILVISNC